MGFARLCFVVHRHLQDATRNLKAKSPFLYSIHSFSGTGTASAAPGFQLRSRTALRAVYPFKLKKGTNWPL
jgi:hypothetical protein